MKRLLALAAGVLALLAATAAPTSAAPASAVADPLCVSPFSSLSRLAPASSAARGKGMREPVLRLGPADSEIPGDNAGAKKGGLVGVDIPVFVHVVTDGAAGVVSDATITQQLAILNLAFSGLYGGVDSGFRFRLKGVDRTNNPAWYAAGPGDPRGARDEEGAQARRSGGAQSVHDERRALPRLGVLPEDRLDEGPLCSTAS